MFYIKTIEAAWPGWANRFHNQCCWLRAGGRSIRLMMSLRISITIYSGETQTDTIIYRRNPCHSHAKTAHTATTFPTHFPVKLADQSNIFSLTVLFRYLLIIRIITIFLDVGGGFYLRCLRMITAEQHRIKVHNFSSSFLLHWSFCAAQCQPRQV